MTKQADRLQLRSGDIVFLAIPQLLYRCVAAATGSPASHVGIAFEEAGGKWLVAESTIPVVTYTPLDDFLAIVVLRIHSLAPKDGHPREPAPFGGAGARLLP
jgi:hypothetical protein